MTLVVGLGNPGSSYEGSRHNVGFRVVDLLARRSGIAVKERRFRALLGLGRIGGQDVILAKPLTYMNLSGHAVKAIMDWHGLESSQLLVIYDDMDLDLGRIRIRPKGSAGGHNGMKSIIALMGSEDFPRVRVGIGRPSPSLDGVEHVLGWFSPEEMPIVSTAIEWAANAVELYLQEGLDEAMNRYNGLVID